MDLQQALGFARSGRESVLTTLRRDGRPALSNVLHHVADDDTIRISTTATRAKARNVARDPWVALHVNGESFFSYAVLEGEATVSEAAADPHDPVADELVDLYRALAGEHEDWEAYRRAMVEEGRVVLTVSPTRAYGMATLPPTSGS